MTAAPQTSPMLDAALEYAERGWHVLPCVSLGKAPLTDHGHHDATTEPETIRQWWRQWPNANVAVSLKASGLVAVDIDLRKPECEWASFAAGVDVPATLTQRTRADGIHYIFAAPLSVTYEGDLPNCRGVDIKHNGYVLMEPSRVRLDDIGRSGEIGRYRIETDDDPAPAPDWLPVQRANPAERSGLDFNLQVLTASDLIDLNAALAAIPNADIGWEAWNRVGMAIYAATDGQPAGKAAWHAWSAKSAKYDAGETDARWSSFAKSPPDRIGAGTIYYMAAEAVPGWQKPSEFLAGVAGEVKRAGPAVNGGRAQSVSVLARAVLIRASDVKAKAVPWIWPGWLAKGMLHLLAGAPGTGKTTLAMMFVATVTRGRTWPDGTTAPAGDCVIWSGEDDPAVGIKPRLEAAGADTERVHIISGITEGGRTRPFDPATDLPALKSVLLEVRPSVLVLDPIVSAVTGDSHKNTEVRRALQPVVDLAAEIGCAVVGITHYAKGTQGRDPTERVVGSLAFAALARVVMATAAPSEPGQPRRLVRSKSNIGPDGGGFAYDLQRVPISAAMEGQTVVWGEPLEGGARELLAEIETSDFDNGPSPAVAAAMDFLRSTLANGPCRAVDVLANAEAAGHAEKTVRRAGKTLGVLTERTGGAAGAGWWTWRLPDVTGWETEL